MQRNSTSWACVLALRSIVARPRPAEAPAQMSDGHLFARGSARLVACDRAASGGLSMARVVSESSAAGCSWSSIRELLRVLRRVVAAFLIAAWVRFFPRLPATRLVFGSGPSGCAPVGPPLARCCDPASANFTANRTGNAKLSTVRRRSSATRKYPSPVGERFDGTAFFVCNFRFLAEHP